MSINIDAYKRAFRARAVARGIDPDRGASEYQAALVRSETRTRDHHARARQLVEESARRQQARPPRLSEGRGFLHYDGALDSVLIGQAASVRWWAYDANQWIAGWDSLRAYQISEFQWACLDHDACFAVFRAAKRLQGTLPKVANMPPTLYTISQDMHRELVREVLAECKNAA